jgi:hypothetical protein
MNDEFKENQDKNKYMWKGRNRGPRYGDGGVGFFMFLSFIGAAVYFVSQAHGFWDGVLGILKAIVWPAFLVFQLLQHFHA